MPRTTLTPEEAKKLAAASVTARRVRALEHRIKVLVAAAPDLPADVRSRLVSLISSGG